MEACRFAMSVGIIMNKRMPRSDWKKKRPADKNIGAWSNFCNNQSLDVFFRLLELDSNVEHPARAAEEFIGGGLRWLNSKGVLEGKNLSALKKFKEFDHLLSDDSTK